MSELSFKPVSLEADIEQRSRPSLSYWQDAWMRLKANKRAFTSLFVVIGMLLFALAGPLVWRVDPHAQDLDQTSKPPWEDRRALVVEPYEPWLGVTANEPQGNHVAPRSVELLGVATTTFVRLVWDPVPNSSGYRIYRQIVEPRLGEPLGLPLGGTDSRTAVSFEDRLDIRPRTYWYSVVALDEQGDELPEATTIEVSATFATTAANAVQRGYADPEDLAVGSIIQVPLHPLGTDYLGRDMLARLIEGARISLFIGIVAPFLFVIAGVIYGSISGFAGGNVDHVLMRFADFVIALPFLLFMILFKLLFGIGPGESGIDRKSVV